ncbi:MAG TPA: GxxExxY protein [Gemmataceae bacterium]|nr:GxxExxY protein [Gemmataceae bacterium]
MEPQINADERGSEEKPEYLYEGLTKRIIGVFYEVYNELGHGFLESVYHKAMVLALRQAGLQVESCVPVPVWFRGELVGAFEADIVVERTVLLELKAAKALESAHEAQTLNYLRATPIEVGLLLNFGPKPQVRRFAFANTRKHPRATVL